MNNVVDFIGYLKSMGYLQIFLQILGRERKGKDCTL